MQISVMRLFASVAEAVSVAERAEHFGLDAVGVGDSPVICPDVYVTMAAILRATRSIRVTTCVTNMVSRHWTAHLGALNSLQEIAPDRSWLTVASGNSAVRMAGLRPQSPDDLRSNIGSLRAALTHGPSIMIAAGGPRMVRLAGQVGDGVLFGCGLDFDLLTQWSQLLDEERVANGRDNPFQRWVHTICNVAASGSTEDVRAAEDEILNAVIGFARHALSSSAERGVPADLADGVSEIFKAYDFASHGKAGPSQSNAALLGAHPRGEELRRFLLDRFAIVGPPDQCTRRIAELGQALSLTGISLSVPVIDPVSLVSRIGQEIVPALRHVA